MKQHICEHLYWIEIISKIFSHNFILMICGGFGGLYGWWWKEKYFYYKEIERDFLKAQSALIEECSFKKFAICDQYFRLLNHKYHTKHTEFVKSALSMHLAEIGKKHHDDINTNNTIKRQYILVDLNYYLKLLRNTKKQKDYLWFVDRSLKDLKISKADKNNLIKLGAKF